MAKMEQAYSSGNWLVQEGNEEEFVSRWTAFTDWSLQNANGAVSFVLVRDSANPRLFLSLGAWETEQAVQAWRQTPEFEEMFGACRELCDEFEAHFYTLAASLGE